MSIQAKVGIDKQKHPEKYCKERGCLWCIVKLDHATQTYIPLTNCENGYCPRHKGSRITPINKPCGCPGHLAPGVHLDTCKVVKIPKS